MEDYTVFTNHRIGNNSTFDTDMDLIEMFTRSFKEPNNKLAQAAVFNYYISQAYHYWNDLDDFMKGLNEDKVTSGKRCDKLILSAYNDRLREIRKRYHLNFDQTYGVEYNELIEKYPLPKNYLTPTELKTNYVVPEELYGYCDSGHGSAKYIKENYETYGNMFNEYITTAHKNFEKSARYSFIDIMRIFQLLANIACLNVISHPYIHDYRINYEENNNRIFLLTNSTGWFYLNTFLYAFFEGLILLGMPSISSTFDGVSGCPEVFYDHDIEHNISIIPNYYYETNNGYMLNENAEIAKNIYYKILSDNLSKEDKEAGIFALWYIIHENTFSDVFLNEVSLKDTFLGIIEEIYNNAFEDGKYPNLKDYYQGSEKYRTLDDCLIFLHNYIIDSNKSDLDYLTEEDIEDRLQDLFDEYPDIVPTASVPLE